MAEHELSILIRAKGALQAARDIGKVDKSVGKLGATAKSGAGHAIRNTALIGAGIAVGVGAAVKAGISSLAELEDATSSVNGAIKEIRPTWSTTGADIAAIANRIERDVGAAFDDKDIVAATAGLIRYGKVSQANLEPAMEVMTDLAARTGSVESASTLLAKAMAAPEKAAGKLARAGVILTKEQQKQITAMVKAGDTAGAQALLLKELEKTTKGAAAASQGPYRRSLAVLADVTEDAQRALGEGFLPVIEKVSDLLGKELAKPGTIKNIREFGKGLASGLDSLIEIARNLPWSQIGDSMKLAGAGAKTLLGAFNSLPPWVQTAVLTGWGLNKLTGGALGSIVGQLGSGLIKGVLGMTAGVVNLKAGTVVGGGGLPGGGPGGKGGGVGAVAALGVAGLIVAAAVPIGEAFADALPPGLKGDGGKGQSEAQTRILRAQAQMQKETNHKLATLTQKGAAAAARHGQRLDRIRAASAKTALAAQRAGERTAGAVRRKKLSVKVSNTTNVKVHTRVTASGIRTSSTYSRRYASSGTSQGGNVGGRSIGDPRR